MFTETNTNKNIAILVGVGLFLFFITRTFAISEPYDRGETLDPACSAGDANCTVDVSEKLFNENASGTITNTISGTNGLVVGKNGTASGTSSISIGQGDGIETSGATASGDYSISIGTNSIASGTNSISLLGTASGTQAIAVGVGANARSYKEVDLGSYPTTYTPSSTSAWSATDRLFNIGNGSSALSTSDAFTVLKNGNIGIGDSTPSYILDINGTGAIKLPVGTTAQRPSSLTAGLFRYNSSSSAAEVYTGSGWTTLGASGGGSSFALIKEDEAAVTDESISASGSLSVAIGSGPVTASGNRSVAIGNGVTASSFREIAVGSWTNNYTPSGTSNWDDNDAIFVVGNGSGEGGESNAMVILKGGGVGFGDLRPSNLRNEVFLIQGETSTVSFNDELGQWDFTSDRDSKNSIKDISYGLDEILDLEPKSFKYKGSDRETLGFIAQDVESVIPEIVSQNQEGVYSMSTEKIVPVLVAAVQELTERVEDLEDELNVTPKPKETPKEESVEEEQESEGDAPQEDTPSEEEVVSEDSPEEDQQASVLASLGNNTNLNGLLLIFAIVLLFANLIVMLSKNKISTSRNTKK